MKLILSDQLWSIKEIMLWARLHGYTPSQSVFGIQETTGTSNTKKLPDTMTVTMILSTYTEPIALQKWLQTCQQEPNRQSDNYINDEEIDVENIKECPRRITIDRRKNGSKKNNNYSTDSTLIPIELDENLLPFHNFVCDTAQEIGIKIEPEEIIPGVLYCAASRVIMQVNISDINYIHFCIRIKIALSLSLLCLGCQMFRGRSHSIVIGKSLGKK